MSASIANSAIYITDTPNQIKKKINSHAFSGGGDTAELHALNGGNCEVDVSFQYLRFFMDSDEELEEIRVAYSSGKMSTSTLKQKCIQVCQELVKGIQEKRAGMDEETVKSFMDPTLPKKSDLKPALVVDAATQKIAKLEIKNP